MEIKIGSSSSFKKAFKKRIAKRGLELRFWEKLELFVKDPYNQSIKTHKLSGEIRALWSFKVENDCKVVFRFLEKDKVLLIDIGTHDEVY